MIWFCLALIRWQKNPSSCENEEDYKNSSGGREYCENKILIEVTGIGTKNIRCKLLSEYQNNFEDLLC